MNERQYLFVFEFLFANPICLFVICDDHSFIPISNRAIYEFENKWNNLWSFRLRCVESIPLHFSNETHKFSREKNPLTRNAHWNITEEPGEIYFQRFMQSPKKPFHRNLHQIHFIVLSVFARRSRVSSPTNQFFLCTKSQPTSILTHLV